MPLIPTYQASPSIKVGTAPETQKMSNEVTNRSAAAAGEVINAAAKVEKTLVDIRDFRENNEADIFVSERKRAIHQEFVNSDDLDTTKYEARMDQVDQEAAKTISGTINRETWAAKNVNHTLVAKYQLKDLARTRGIDAAKGTVALKGQTFAENIGTMSDTEVHLASADLWTSYDSLVKLGGMNKDEAKFLFNKDVNTANINRAEYSVYNDQATKEEDSVVLAELKKGKDGIYNYLTPGQSIDLIKKDQQRIFQNNQTFKRDLDISQNVRHDSILDKISQGTLTLKDIDNELLITPENGGVPKKTLISYQRGIERGIENDLKSITSAKTAQGKLTPQAVKAKKYLELIDSFVDDKVDLWKAREKMAEAFSDSILNPKELKFLDNLKNDLQDIEWNRKSGIIKSTIESTKQKLKIQSNPSDEEVALRIKQLLNGVNAGTDPKQMESQVVSEQINDDMSKAIKTPISKQGRIFANDGTQRIYSDDNGLTWYGVGNNEEIK